MDIGLNGVDSEDRYRSIDSPLDPLDTEFSGRNFATSHRYEWRGVERRDVG